MSSEKMAAKVAVVGAGICGLAAIKNLREEGFEVVAFEQRDGIGGLWRFSPNPDVTTVLPSTLSNVSKFKSRYTDFTPREDYPAFMTASQVVEYITEYATHFKLHDYIELNTGVSKVERNKEDTKWLVHTVRKEAEGQVRDFDKVVFCSGPNNKPFLPAFEGEYLFKGKLIHSRAFKAPEDFKGLSVVVVGFGNTAVDTATSLLGHANEIHLSHRQGINIFPRQIKSKPIDFHVSHRLEAIKHTLTNIAPQVAANSHDNYVKSLTVASFGALDPSWHIHPPPSIKTHQPTITDELIPALREGKITSVTGIQSFTGPSNIKLLDGTELSSIDAVIFCTGYEADYSVLDPEIDPTRDSPITTLTTDSDSSGKGYIKSGPISSLYQNVFHPKYPTSLAFTCDFAFTTAIFPIADLLSMAIAQLWSPAGSSRLSFPPSESVMLAEIARHRDWVLDLAAKDGTYSNIIDEGPWLTFLHEAAGTRVPELMGLGWRGWAYWITHPRFASLMWGGIDSPASWRLFDGPGRKKWEGAKGAIIQANEEALRWCTEGVNERK